MKNHITLIALAVFCSVILFGLDIQMAFAINVMTITSPASSVVNEIAYQQEGLVTNKAYLVGNSGGSPVNGTIFIKNHNSATTGSDATDTTINLENFRIGTENAHTVVYVPRTNASLNWDQWIVYTNIGAFSFSNQNDQPSQNVAGAGGSQIVECKFSTFDNAVYCLNIVSSLIWKINPENIENAIQTIDFTESPTTFAIDGTSGFIFIALVNTLGNPYVKRFNMASDTFDLTLNSDSACDGSSGGIAVDESDDTFWVSCSSDSSVRKITQAGSVIQTIASISTPRFMELDSVARRMYVVSDTTDQVQIWDVFNKIALSTQSVCNYQNTPLDVRRQSSSTFNPENHIKVGIPCLGTSTSQLIDDSSPADLSEGEEEEVPFCERPENVNILICRLGGDGTLGSGGAFIVGNTTEGTGILGISCSIGVVDCVADPNPQTNGLGLLIFIASLFVIVGMFFKTLGGSATFQMPIFIWIIIIIALSAFFTITGLIDPVFLILSIIALIALGAPKIINTIRGGSFGGGSTE